MTGAAAGGMLAGAVAVVFCAALTYGFVALAVRAGRLDDMHVRRRADRPLVMVVARVSLLLGRATPIRLGASARLLEFLGAVLGVVAVAPVAVRLAVP